MKLFPLQFLRQFAEFLSRTPWSIVDSVLVIEVKDVFFHLEVGLPEEMICALSMLSFIAQKDLLVVSGVWEERCRIRHTILVFIL